MSKVPPFRFLDDEEFEKLSHAERLVYFENAAKQLHKANQTLLRQITETHKPKGGK
jgi:hypothetical protein